MRHSRCSTCCRLKLQLAKAARRSPRRCCHKEAELASTARNIEIALPAEPTSRKTFWTLRDEFIKNSLLEHFMHPTAHVTLSLH